MNSRLELNPGTKLALMKSLPSSSSVGCSFTLLWSYGRIFVNLKGKLHARKSVTELTYSLVDSQVGPLLHRAGHGRRV